jgi:hypothetical protein
LAIWALQKSTKHLATLYLEDISDLIKLCVDEHFGFSRYAEKLGRSANSFDELYEALRRPYTYIDEILLQLLHQNIEKFSRKLFVYQFHFLVIYMQLLDADNTFINIFLK